MIRIVDRRRFVIFILGALVLSGALINFIFFRAPVRRSGEITIQEGQAAQTVWAELKQSHFTRTTLPWRYGAWRLSASDKLQAGKYRLEAGERVQKIVERFAQGDVLPNEFTVTYPEGFTIEQIAARTVAKGIGTTEDFKKYATPEPYSEIYAHLAEVPESRVTLEGYLFPDTYRLAADDTPEKIIRRMLQNFDDKVTAELRAEIKQANHTLDQVVIMASIVEREVTTDEDMAQVSGILWKRFDDGVGLDADATVRYLLNKWDGVLTVQDLRTDSLYNTRRYRGLPPGPISNPGMRALLAAIRPQASDYYYYLSTPEGETIFSKTNAEHNQNKAKYLK